jgi:hypothetical protein
VSLSVVLPFVWSLLFATDLTDVGTLVDSMGNRLTIIEVNIVILGYTSTGLVY